MKVNSKLHGILDYVVVLFLWLSPTIFSLPEITSTFTYILGAVHLCLTVFTRFELGLIKLIPLNIHGWIEVLVSISLVGVAFLLGNVEGELARNFYLGFSIAVFLTWLVTDYQSTTN